ncbi:MAG: c-type cytochrome [Alphaproteobacteria bacterium]
MRLWNLSTTAAVVAMLLAGCDDGAQVSAAPDPAVIARGKALFVGTCGAYCHKMTDTGGDALFLFDCDWKHGATDDDIFRVINEGVEGTRMVAFGGAFPEGDKDARALVAYLRAASQCKT